MLVELIAIILPVIAVVALGYAWQRGGKPFEAQFVTRLVTMIGTPCLIFATLTSLEVPLAAYGQILVAGLTIMVCLAILGFASLRILGLSYRAFLPTLIFPNAGNLGLPLSFFAFGEEGLALAITFFSLVSILQFTAGQAIAVGAMSPARLLQTPIIYVLALAAIMIVTDAPVPRWLDNTVSLLAGVTIPLLLLSLGSSLARVQPQQLKVSLTVGICRLIIGFAVSVAVTQALGLDRVASGVLIIQTSAPAAVFNYLFAQLYGNRPEEVGGVVLVSTLLYFLLLPALLLLVL